MCIILVIAVAFPQVESMERQAREVQWSSRHEMSNGDREKDLKMGSAAAKVKSIRGS
jgi:hypothetical protein